MISAEKCERMDSPHSDRVKTALLIAALGGLSVGLSLHFAGRVPQADIAWNIGVVPVLVALVAEILRSLRRGEVGLDIVAALSMSAALVFGESLAAAVVAVMYSVEPFLRATPKVVRDARCTTFCRGCPGPLRAIVTAALRTFRLTMWRQATAC
jgi:cation transport ATPase